MSRLPRRFGRYVLLEQLGHGGMGTVYLARPVDRHAGLPTFVVLKVLHSELTQDDLFVRRFRHEAEIATRIDSPHVVKVYESGRVGDELYFAMEQIVGFNLADMLADNIRTKQPTPLSFLRVLVRGALAGLDALHSAVDENNIPLGFVHRDLSPKNVMLGPNLNVYLIDLGIGKSEAQDWKTKTGIVLGTVGYMSPEQVMGYPLDLRSDLYAFAIVIFELLTLTRYIERGPVAQALRASVAPRFRPPSSLRKGLPPAIDRVLERALAHAPEHRYQNAAELEAALLKALPAADARTEEEELRGVREMIDDALSEVEPKTQLGFSEDELATEDPAQSTEIFATRLSTAPAFLLPRPVSISSSLSSSLGQYNSGTPMVMASAALEEPSAGRPSWAIIFGLVSGIAAVVVLGIRLWMPPDDQDDPVVPAKVPALVPAMIPRVEQPASAKVEVTQRENPARDTQPVQETPALQDTPPPVDREPRAPKLKREQHVNERPAVVSKPEVASETPAAVTPESTVDRLIGRAQTLRKRVPETAPKRGNVDALLADLLQLRASNRLASERAEVDRVARELDALERELLH